MNYLIGAIGTQITLGLISNVTSAANGMYTFCKTITSSTSNGAKEVRKIIQVTDLEFKVRHTHALLCELKVSKNTPFTIQQCVQDIHDAIKKISEELDTIHYRMQYNDNLWFGSSIRAYKFHNCKSRLETHLKVLDARKDELIKLIPIQGYLVQNPDLDDPLKGLLQIEQIDPSIAKKNREDLHKKLCYIGK